MAEALTEGQPFGRVTPMLLRQWYTKYHPESGPLRIATAEALEDRLGDEIRRGYPDFKCTKLRATWANRRKLVLVSERTARTWVDQYGHKVVCRRRSSIVSTSSCTSTTATTITTTATTSTTATTATTTTYPGALRLRGAFIFTTTTTAITTTTTVSYTHLTLPTKRIV